MIFKTVPAKGKHWEVKVGFSLTIRANRQSFVFNLFKIPTIFG